MNKLYVVLGVIAFFVICIIAAINNLIYLKRRMERAKSTIDVFLKKRFDLIPNLVECVKGYTKYEQETLERIVKLRTEFNKNMTSSVVEELNEHYKNLLAVVEQYPDIKASANFLNLQKNLTKVEDEIAASRRLYVNDITNYNTKIKSVPTNILAGILGYKECNYPELETEEIKIEI